MCHAGVLLCIWVSCRTDPELPESPVLLCLGDGVRHDGDEHVEVDDG